MPVPPAEAPQWVVNLSVVMAAIATGVGGYFIKRFEGRKTEAPDTSRVIAVGGMLQDSRALEALTAQLNHNERAMRDAERATIDNTREVKDACEMMGDVRRALEARNRAAEAEQLRLLAAIDKARGEGKP